jgi:hypothetical protein
MSGTYRILVNGPMGAGKTYAMFSLSEHRDLSYVSYSRHDNYNRKWGLKEVDYYDIDGFFDIDAHKKLSDSKEYDNTHQEILNEKMMEYEKKKDGVKIFIYFGLLEYEPTKLFFGDFDKKYMLLPPVRDVLKFYYKRASNFLERSDISILSSRGMKEHYNEMVDMAKSGYEIHSECSNLTNNIARHVLGTFRMLKAQ